MLFVASASFEISANVLIYVSAIPQAFQVIGRQEVRESSRDRKLTSFPAIQVETTTAGSQSGHRSLDTPE